MKISCLTITQNNRLPLLSRCIKSFVNQTIDKNERELIIVHHEGNETTEAIKDLLTDHKTAAVILQVEKCPLGKLRNYSIEAASGELLCQWDDDDFYHNDRLKIQCTAFENTKTIATTLESQICLFINDTALYIRKGGKEGIHGTLIIRKNANLKYDPTLRKGEDSTFISNLIKIYPSGIHCVVNHPQLYVRTYHGKNTWDWAHHHDRLTHQAMNKNWIEKNESKIRGWMNDLDIRGVGVYDNFHNLIISC